MISLFYSVRERATEVEAVSKVKVSLWQRKVVLATVWMNAKRSGCCGTLPRVLLTASTTDLE